MVISIIAILITIHARYFWRTYHAQRQAEPRL
ncbi:MAG: hypothetical protein ACP5I8_16840 [Phycisphaerae bacterium]